MVQAARKHEPDITRQRLLEAAAAEIHVHGFQSASMKAILHKAGVTKGALYHHFASKLDLGYAVVDEVIGRQLLDMWVLPLQQQPENVLDTLIRMIETAGDELTDTDIEYGCPLNNLAQEMSPIDEGFRNRINALYEHWEKALTEGLQQGKDAGNVAPEIDPKSMAIFIIASLEGCVGLAKQAGSREMLLLCGCGLISALKNMKNE
ncbi:MAG: TetR family transcriptional regulator C-terminal domain-containing protein [bacterium]